MKNRYERLTREEKKQAKKEFNAYDAKHSNFCKRLNRLRTIGIIGMLFSVCTFAYDLYMIINVSRKNFNYISIVIDIILFLFCIFYVISANHIYAKQVNYYLIEKKNNKDKKKKKKKTKKEDINS